VHCSPSNDKQQLISGGTSPLVSQVNGGDGENVVVEEKGGGQRQTAATGAGAFSGNPNETKRRGRKKPRNAKEMSKAMTPGEQSSICGALLLGCGGGQRRGSAD
jgi:hypothetical protein